MAKTRSKKKKAVKKKIVKKIIKKKTAAQNLIIQKKREANALLKGIPSIQKITKIASPRQKPQLLLVQEEEFLIINPKSFKGLLPVDLRGL